MAKLARVSKVASAMTGADKAALIAAAQLLLGAFVFPAVLRTVFAGDIASLPLSLVLVAPPLQVPGQVWASGTIQSVMGVALFVGVLISWELVCRNVIQARRGYAVGCTKKAGAAALSAISCSTYCLVAMWPVRTCSAILGALQPIAGQSISVDAAVWYALCASLSCAFVLALLTLRGNGKMIGWILVASSALWCSMLLESLGLDPVTVLAQTWQPLIL